MRLVSFRLGRLVVKATPLRLCVNMSEVMIQKWHTASSLARAKCTDHFTYIIGNSCLAGGLRFGLLPIATCGLTASREVFLHMSQLRRTMLEAAELASAATLLLRE